MPAVPTAGIVTGDQEQRGSCGDDDVPQVRPGWVGGGPASASLLDLEKQALQRRNFGSEPRRSVLLLPPLGVALSCSVLLMFPHASLRNPREGVGSSSGNVQWHVHRSAAMTRAPSLIPKSSATTPALRGHSHISVISPLRAASRGRTTPNLLLVTHGRVSRASASRQQPLAEEIALPTTLNKRIKEKSRQEKQQGKALRRAQRREQRNNRAPVKPGEDPDLAGIVPGPQPLSDDDGP